MAVRGAARPMRSTHPERARLPVVLGIAEGLDVAGRGHQPVAVAGGVGHDRRAADPPQPPIPGHDPSNAASPKANTPPSAATMKYPRAVDRRDHPDNRRIQTGLGSRAGGSDADAGDRAVEPGVTEGKDAAVGGHQPVAAVVRRWE